MLKILKSDNKLSFITLFTLFGVIVALRFIYPPVNVLSWDVFGYYLYLPAKFIYHDLGLKDQTWLNKLIAQYGTTGTLYQAYIGPTGNWVMKYSLGMAVLYMPFFFIAHWMAGILGYPMDGLSLPYQYGIAIGGLVYTILGLIFFRKILLRYFKDSVVTIVLILTVLGTNYINQVTVGNLLSHNFLFSLLAAFIWFTIKWHEKNEILYFVLIAGLTGMITLIRPTEGVCIAIPLLWGVYNKESLLAKVKLLNRNRLQLGLGIICFLVVLVPQFYYWKKYAGSLLFYSYPNPGEGLDFLSPHISNFLFSFRKGWFVYTPMLIFYVTGLILLYRKNRGIFVPVILYFVVSLYLISSWTCWWYAGGCYSQRAILSLYIVLGIGLGFLIEHSLKLGLLKRLIVYFFMFMFVVLNLFQFWQFNKDILKHDGMTKAYYCAIFGKTKAPENASYLLLVDRSVTGIEKFNDEGGFDKKIIGTYPFTSVDKNSPERYVKDVLDTGQYCLTMDSSYIFSPGLTMKYKNITGEYYAWIRASIDVRYSKEYNDAWPAVVMTFEHNGGSYKYFAGDLVCKDEEKGQWKTISFDYQTPEVRDVNDVLKVYVWHRGKKTVFLRNLVVEVYEPIVE